MLIVLLFNVLSIFGGLSVKNRADAPILHTAICAAGATK